MAFAILTWAFVTAGFLGRLRGAPTPIPLLPMLYYRYLRGLGRARRLAAAVGTDPRGVDRGGAGVLAGSLPSRRGGAGARGPWAARQPRLPGVPDLHFSNPFERLLPALVEGRDLNPLLQDVRPDRASADAVHGLCRLLGAVRVRDRRAARTATPRGRRALAALGAAVDQCRLGLLTARHRTGQLVGLLRARLGRLVVLGSGRERELHAVAGRRRAAALAGGHGKARLASAAGRCCWRSRPSRCRCSAPSSCARAC